MKLVRSAGIVVALSALAACASAPRTSASAPVTLTVAEWAPLEPRVGKPQRAEDLQESPKEPRRDDKRPGGGFSGWK
jgi:hypothetical protein